MHGARPIAIDAARDHVAWFHCFSGIAGDMALGALVDAGADLDEVRELCERAAGRRLGARGRAGHARRHRRAPRSTSHAEPRPRVVRTAAHITGLVEEARLPDRVRDGRSPPSTRWPRPRAACTGGRPSRCTSTRSAGIDAIIDVVGTCAALELLGVDEVHCQPRRQGIGMVRAAHGLLPNPAPAVVELLRGAPTLRLDIAVELTTPTGAALLAALVDALGSDAGDDDRRDRLRRRHRRARRRGRTSRRSSSAPLADALPTGQPVMLLEVNVDDATGETLAHAVAMLLDAGAHDAWLTPILMKKGRPAHTVSALCDPALAGQVAATLRARDRFARRARPDARAVALGASRGRGRRRAVARPGQGRAPDG